jgi:hypothetical protein
LNPRLHPAASGGGQTARLLLSTYHGLIKTVATISKYSKSFPRMLVPYRPIHPAAEISKPFRFLCQPGRLLVCYFQSFEGYFAVSRSQMLLSGMPSYQKPASILQESQPPVQEKRLTINSVYRSSRVLCVKESIPKLKTPISRRWMDRGRNGTAPAV